MNLSPGLSYIDAFGWYVGLATKPFHYTKGTPMEAKTAVWHELYIILSLKVKMLSSEKVLNYLNDHIEAFIFYC